jgi:hypothetical protein
MSAPHRRNAHTRPIGASWLRIFIAALAFALIACTSQDAPAGQPAVPPIDLAAPEKTETATFALG